MTGDKEQIRNDARVQSVLFLLSVQNDYNCHSDTLFCTKIVRVRIFGKNHTLRQVFSFGLGLRRNESLVHI